MLTKSQLTSKRGPVHNPSPLGVIKFPRHSN